MSAFAIVEDELHVCKDGENWESLGKLKTIEHLTAISFAQTSKLRAFSKALFGIRSITSEVLINEGEGD